MNGPQSSLPLEDEPALLLLDVFVQGEVAYLEGGLHTSAQGQTRTYVLVRCHPRARDRGAVLLRIGAVGAFGLTVGSGGGRRRRSGRSPGGGWSLRRLARCAALL